MRFLNWALALLLFVCRAEANVKAVFAHFMVSNTGSYTVADWEDDISKAQSAHIDGFALNMAHDEETNGASLANAFTAANNLGSSFKMMFSFDYAGNGLWPKADVIALIQKYASNAAYYHRGSQPLVSTFEGPKASDDWEDIKAKTKCFFIPSWSSLGAVPAWDLGTADGLFSWAAWPSGPDEMSVFTDASYTDALRSSPYMMGVSPWFYTNVPGFRKNWLWRSDNLWFDRWIHVMTLQPEYVEIITWNDYAESHYIGPLKDKAMVAFTTGKAPFNYATNMPHDGWRQFLPYLIDLAKTNHTSFSSENVVGWFRRNPKGSCGTGGTTGNTASQLQTTWRPSELVEDKVFFAALLASNATFQVTVGGVKVPTVTKHNPMDGIGIFRGEAAYSGKEGDVVISVIRGGSEVFRVSGSSITSDCTDGLNNWNPIVITGTGHAVAETSPLSLDQSACTGGFGDTKYQGLCEFACKYNYCPTGACTCTSLGAAIPRPPALGVNGCPASGKDATYLGLCSFSCNYDFCPDACVVPKDPATKCTALVPTAPPVPRCIKGEADGDYAELCGFSCSYGFCPPEICTCKEAGTTSPTEPSIQDAVGSPAGSEDYGLCAWTCPRGKCPADLCSCEGSDCAYASNSEPQAMIVMDTSSYAEYLNTEMGAACFQSDTCTDQDNPSASACDAGYSHVGSRFSDQCKPGSKTNWGLSICCPTYAGLGDCTWRGNPSDCNGQCHQGETKIFEAHRGGSPGESDSTKCTRGTKVFCCAATSVGEILEVQNCGWTKCGHYCDASQEQLISKKCSVFSSQHYCCDREASLYDCHWKGSTPDCPDNRCDKEEITIDVSSYGSSGISCSWGRKKSACCKVGSSLPVSSPETCSDTFIDFCETYGICGEGDEEEDAPIEGILATRSLAWIDDLDEDEISILEGDEEEDAPEEGILAARSPAWIRSSAWIDDLDKDEISILESRGARNKYLVYLSAAENIVMETTSRAYYSRKQYIEAAFRQADKIYSFEPLSISDTCKSAVSSFGGQLVTYAKGTTDALINAKTHTEHIIERQQFNDFIISTYNNIRPDGLKYKTPPVSADFWQARWNDAAAIAGKVPNIAGSSFPNKVKDVANTANNFAFECLGSTTNVGAHVLLWGPYNLMKKNLVKGNAMVAADWTTKYVQTISRTFLGDKKEILAPIRSVVAVIQYLNNPVVQNVLSEIDSNVLSVLKFLDNNADTGGNLHKKWTEFLPASLQTIQNHSVAEVEGLIAELEKALWYYQPEGYAEVVSQLLAARLALNAVPGLKKMS